MTDYLWDKTGEPDAETERLEKLLAVYRQERRFAFPATAEEASHPVAQEPRATRAGQPLWLRSRWIWAVAAAAVIVVAVIAIMFAAEARSQVQWEARRSAGDPKLNAKAMARGEAIEAGGVISTDAQSEVELKAGGHGRIRVLPGSEVRLVESGARHQRLELEHGAIEARLFAPPFMFSFATPSGTAYDIGCAFRLAVDQQKRGKLEVLSGWVQFEVGAEQSLAPAGTQVEIQPGFAPGTAVYEDASATLKDGVHRLDFGGTPERAVALNEVLAQARPKDIYTLLALMRSASDEERGMIFDRARELKPPPSWVTREGIMRREEAMMYAWRESLGLGDAKRWWVNWRDRF
jgi:hypothetical protein